MLNDTLPIYFPRSAVEQFTLVRVKETSRPRILTPLNRHGTGTCGPAFRPRDGPPLNAASGKCNCSKTFGRLEANGKIAFPLDMLILLTAGIKERTNIVLLFLGISRGVGRSKGEI